MIAEGDVHRGSQLSFMRVSLCAAAFSSTPFLKRSQLVAVVRGMYAVAVSEVGLDTTSIDEQKKTPLVDVIVC